MQVKEVKSEGLSHELEVTVPANEIKQHLETRLQEVGKTVKMPGFRPGKVPMDILMQRYGRAVMGEVLESAVNDATAKVLHEKKLRPAMQPKIEVKEFDEGKDLIYKMELDVLPSFTAMDVKGLKIEKPIAKITDEEVAEALERVRSHHKSSKPIEGDRATKKGDFVVIDFSGRTKDDGVEHEGMQAQGHKLELGSGQFIPGFEDQLTGKKAKEKVEVNVTFPENYGDKGLSGREAIFDVDIKEIHEATDAVINDDFAKELGFDDEKALRDALKHQLQMDYEHQTRLKMKRQLLDTLDEGHTFDIPSAMMDAELEGITTQIQQERKHDPEAKEEELSDKDKEELEVIAERRVRLGLVIAELGQQNNITVNDQELQRAVISEAQKFPGQEKMIFDYYQKNPQALDNLRAPLFEDKVCDFIFEQADVTEKEVSVEELLEDNDDERLEAAKAKKKSTKKKSSKKPASKKSAKKSTKKSAKKSKK